MIRKEKIILMTKLAVYDKYEGEADRRANEYYRHDYIFKKNIWTRFCAAVGAVILLAFDWLWKIFVKEIDLSLLNYRQELLDAVFFIVAVMILYTLIGTVKATVEYNRSQKRLQKYFYVLNKLDRLQLEDSDHDQEEPDGTDIIYTRDNY